MRAAALALVLPLLGGCGDKDDDTSGPPGGRDSSEPAPAGCFDHDPDIEVGTGAASFVSLNEGDPVVMVHGPQGGWHLLGSVRAWNMTDVVQIHFLVTVEETGAVVADNSLYVQMIREEECLGVYPGMYAYLNVTALADGDRDTPPELLAYQRLVFTATVTDQDGREVTASLPITATPDPSDLGDADTGHPG